MAVPCPVAPARLTKEANFRRIQMSMIQCKECKTEMADTAESCPKCGAANKKINRKRRGNVQGCGCLIFLLGIPFIFLLPPLGVFLAAVGFIILIVGLLL